MSKMKKTLMYLFGLSIILSSCVAKEDLSSGTDTDNDDKVIVDYETVKPTQLYKVPVQEGCISQVFYDGELVYETDTETMIEIPKRQYSTTNRSADEGVYVSYQPTEGYTPIELNRPLTYKVIMFEDTEHGDMDYNDLIFHVFQQLVQSTGLVTLKLQPIAIGNTIKLRLGADCYMIDSNGAEIKNTTFYFTDDIKKDYFQESTVTKMINTSPTAELQGYKPKAMTVTSNPSGEYSAIGYRANGTGFCEQSMVGKNILINWFIEVPSGKKFYAIPITEKPADTWLSQKNGYPYGFVIPELRGSVFVDSKGNKCGRDWINYPSERTHIKDVYPGFDSWVQGGSTTPDWNNPVEGTFIDAMRIGPDGIHSVNSLYDENITTFK